MYHFIRKTPSKPDRRTCVAFPSLYAQSVFIEVDLSLTVPCRCEENARVEGFGIDRYEIRHVDDEVELSISRLLLERREGLIELGMRTSRAATVTALWKEGIKRSMLRYRSTSVMAAVSKSASSLF